MAAMRASTSTCCWAAAEGGAAAGFATTNGARFAKGTSVSRSAISADGPSGVCVGDVRRGGSWFSTDDVRSHRGIMGKVATAAAAATTVDDCALDRGLGAELTLTIRRRLANLSSASAAEVAAAEGGRAVLGADVRA